MSLFRRSSTPKDDEVSKDRLKAPKLATKLSDLGDRVRRIRTSPSQPNISTFSNSSDVPPVPQLPATPTSSSMRGLFRPPPGTRQSPLLLDQDSRLSPPRGGLAQSRSMETLPTLPTKSLDAREEKALPAPPTQEPEHSAHSRMRSGETATSRRHIMATTISGTSDEALRGHPPTSPLRIYPETHLHSAASIYSSPDPASPEVAIAADLLQALESDPVPTGRRSQPSQSIYHARADSLTDDLTAANLFARSVTSLAFDNADLSEEPRRFTAVEKGKSRDSGPFSVAEPGGPLSSSRISDHSLAAPPRVHTYSNASTGSLGSQLSRSRFADAPQIPPVPKLPPHFTSLSLPPVPPFKSVLPLELASKQQPKETSGSNPPKSSRNGPNDEVEEVEISIAVVGSAGCGKSEFVWKGMKVWGLEPFEHVTIFEGVKIIQRLAHPSMNLDMKHSQRHSSARSKGPQGHVIKTTHHRQSHSLSELEKEEDERDAASTLHERRQVGRVTLFEVDSGSLLDNIPTELTVEDIVTRGRGTDGKDKDKEVARWAWPEGFPHVDGVLLCYDSSNEKSIVGLEELCAAYQVLELPSLAIECKRDLEQRVGRDLMAIRMRKYSIGLVETDSKSDKGKRAGRAAFKWIIRSVLRGRQGATRADGSKWKNPASPDVLRALPWESENNVFTPSSPPPTSDSNFQQSTMPSSPTPNPPNLPSLDTTTQPPPDIPLPASPSISDPPPPSTIPKAGALQNDPLYQHLLTVKPTSLPEVFVRDTDAFKRSGMEAMMSSRGEIIDPASLSRKELLNMVGKKSLLSPQDVRKGPKGSMSAAPLFNSASVPSTPSSKEKARARTKALERDRASMMDETEAKYAVMPVAAALIEQAKADERAAAARMSNASSSSSSSAPWRAKSSPELSASTNSKGSVRFQVDAALNALRPRRSSTKGSISIEEESIPPVPPRPSGPPSIPPLHIPQVSSFTGAAEDILRLSQESSVHADPITSPDSDHPGPAERRESAIQQVAEEMRASRSQVQEMDAAQTIEWIIQSSQKKKQDPLRPILTTLDNLLDVVVNMCMRDIRSPFLNTFLISLRVYATPREVIEGLHKRMVIIGWGSNTPIAHYRQARVSAFIFRWMREHPTDFCAGPANDQLVKLLNWMRSQCHLLHYASELLPLAKQMQRQKRDPDVLYAKPDSLAPPKIYYDNEPVPESSDDGSDTETEARHEQRTQSTIKRRTDSKTNRNSTPRTATGISTSSPVGIIRRTQSATDSSDNNKHLKASKSSATIGPSTQPLRIRSSKRSEVIITPYSPIGPIQDSRAEVLDAALQTQLKLFGRLEVVNEERRAVGNMRILPRVAATLRMNPIDVITGKTPPVFNYTPMVIDSTTSAEARIKELQTVASKFLLMEPFMVAQEMTNIQKPYFLAIQPRDWIRHSMKPRPRAFDDDPTLRPQKRLPKWMPADDNIDMMNHIFSHWVNWSTSLIVAPDAFSDRAKVIIHIVKIAQALRNHNDYFTAHALVVGVRQTLWPGDRMFKHFAASPTYKTWLSLSLLFGFTGASAAYRLGLKHTIGPAIVDLSVHVVDLTRFKESPDFSIWDSEKINFGKWAALCKTLEQIADFQRRFSQYNTHDFISRPKVRTLIMNSPIMTNQSLVDRTTPKDPKHGSEHPRWEAIKRRMGVKSTGPAYNPKARMPDELPKHWDKSKIKIFPGTDD